MCSSDLGWEGGRELGGRQGGWEGGRELGGRLEDWGAGRLVGRRPGDRKWN